MTLRTTLGVLFVTTALVGCSKKTEEIDDPGMQATGRDLGQKNAELAALAPDASESEVQGKVQNVGGSLQSLVSQHQAYSESGLTAAPYEDDGAAAQDDAGTFSWDGSRLQMDWTFDESGISYSYGIDLTIAASGDGQVLDGTYNFDYDISVVGVGTRYQLDAVYDALTTDGAGCMVSGSLDVTYDYDVVAGGIGLPGGASGSGRVIVTYNGCDDVTISGS